MGVVSKELAAHKEMVAELRKQLAEKENELQVCSPCMGKYHVHIAHVYVHVLAQCRGSRHKEHKENMKSKRECIRNRRKVC